MADNVVVTVPEKQIIAGRDGFDPVVDSERILGGHRLWVMGRSTMATFQVMDGVDGLSAYQQAVIGGYEGTEEQFAQDLINFAPLAAQAAASAEAAGASELNAAVSELKAKESADSAETSKTDAETAADRAEQAASSAGYMFFRIDENEHLIYERTPNTQVDFYLDNGHLYVDNAAAKLTWWVTPEEYGAVGDGVTDDAPALKAALESGKPVVLASDLHMFTPIMVEDKSVRLDGNGHTITLHGESMTESACIFIRSTPHEGAMEGADVVVHSELSGAERRRGGVLNPGFPETSYRRGYLSYHGFNPTPDKEVYEDEELQSWKEHRVVITDTVFSGENTAGKTFLRVYQTCHSRISNCLFVVPDGEDAVCGIDAFNSYDLKITGCTADGFCADEINHSWGYGIKANGDAILIDGCTVKNCKVGVCVGGGGEYMSTGVLISNLIAQVKDSGRNAQGGGGRLYQQLLDLHEGCLRPVVENAWLQYENASANDVIGTLIQVSCPEATLSNIQAQYHSLGGWNPGYVGFGPLVRRVHFYNLYAPKCRLYVRGWSGLESGDSYAPNYIKEIEIDGGEIGSIRDANGLVKLRLSGVKITGLIEGVQQLAAQNCVIRSEDQFQTSVTPITVIGEASFVNCDICGPINPNAPRSKPVIATPGNRVRLTACTIRKRLDCKLFKTEQPEPVSTVVYDLFGLILGSQVSPLYVDGDACILDDFNLW